MNINENEEIKLQQNWNFLFFAYSQ